MVSAPVAAHRPRGVLGQPAQGQSGLSGQAPADQKAGGQDSAG